MMGFLVVITKHFGKSFPVGFGQHFCGVVYPTAELRHLVEPRGVSRRSRNRNREGKDAGQNPKMRAAAKHDSYRRSCAARGRGDLPEATLSRLIDTLRRSTKARAEWSTTAPLSRLRGGPGAILSAHKYDLSYATSLRQCLRLARIAKRHPATDWQ